MIKSNRDYKKNDIEKLISKFEIISFDIYDTLIVRPFIKPIDLFKYIELDQKIRNFSKIRITAEKKTRRLLQKRQGEISLDNIYEFMPNNLHYCKDIEIYYETKYTYKHTKNSIMYEEAIRQNKKIIFISDMYLPRNVIENILKKNDYIKYDALFLSGELGKTKRKGDLFQHVIDELHLNSEKTIHIGDNYINDIEQAKNYNLHTFYVPNYIDTFLNKPENIKFKKFLKDEKGSLYSSILVSIFAYRDLSGFKNYMYNQIFSYYIGGIVTYSYLQFINNLVKKEDFLLFIARDGYLLQKFYNIMFKNPNKNSYIQAQRRLYYSMYFSKKYSLHIFPKIFNLPLNKYIRHFYPYSFIKKYKKEIASWLYKNKKEYKKYLNSLNLSGNCFVSIDMITENYTSQKFISKLLNKSDIKGLFFASSTLNKKPNIYIFIGKELLFKKKWVYLVIEHLFTSNKPPILTIENGKPVYKSIDIKEQVNINNKLLSIEKGISLFLSDILKSFPNLYFPPEVINNFIYSYVQYPNQQDIEYYQNCFIDDGNINNACNVTLYDKLKGYFKIIF